MTAPYEQLRPDQIEQKLVALVKAMTAAEFKLREARDAETDAEILFRSAHRRAMLSDKCPKVSRTEHTTAYRDAWVEEVCSEEWEAYRRAQTTCAAAKDHISTQRDVVSAVQSIAGLWKSTYSVSGVHGA